MKNEIVAALSLLIGGTMLITSISVVYYNSQWWIIPTIVTVTFLVGVVIGVGYAYKTTKRR